MKLTMTPKKELLYFIIIVVFAFCLVACSASEPAEPVESAEMESELSLKSLVAEIDSHRADDLKDENYLKSFKKEYEEKYQQNYSSITPEEALELVTIRERKDFVTYQQAVEDVDLFFRMLRYRLGRYELLGGDEVFYKARDAVMNKLTAYKDKTIKTSELASIMVSELTFIDDTHFEVDNISPFYDFNVETKKYQTYLSGLNFMADKTGYYINEENEKLYFSSCDNENASVVPMLNDNGELTYTLILYCAHAEKPSSSVVTFKGNNTITREITWIDTLGTRVTNGLVYSETDNLAYIGLTGCGTEVEWKLEKIGYNASKKDVVILDLRGNGGTHAQKFLNGYMKYPLTIDEVVLMRVGLTNYLNDIKPGEEYTSFTQFSNEWIITESEPLIVVLVDNHTGCAPEEFTRYFQFISNSIVIGTNTMGQLDGGITVGNWDLNKYDPVHLHLPNSGMAVVASTSVSLYGDYESFVGKGFKPNIYVADTSMSLDYTLKLLVNEGYITNEDVEKLDIYHRESLEKEEEVHYEVPEFDKSKAIKLVKYDSKYGKYYEARKTLTMDDNEMHFIWTNPDTTKRYWVEIMSSGPDYVYVDSVFWIEGDGFGTSFNGGRAVIGSSFKLSHTPAYGIIYKQAEFFKPVEVIFRFFPIENYEQDYNWIDMDITVGETRPIMILVENDEILRVRVNNGYQGSYDDWPNKPY